MTTGLTLENLFRSSDLKKKPLPKFVEKHKKAFHQVFDWTQNYLCKSHPELGRRGPVCPFVGPSIEKDLFFLTAVSGQDFPKTMIRYIMLGYRDQFLQLPPRKGEDVQFKTILVLFPDLPLEKVKATIDKNQAELAEEFAPMGLMIGEFHSGPPDKPGLWNRDFRPLNCPVPMLVIRHMVPTDILFLKRKQSLFEAYLKNFGDRIPVRMRDMAVEALEKYGLDWQLPSEVDPVT